MEREEATQKILEAKRERGLTFEAIGHEVGRHKEWTTAALYGQASMSGEEAERATAVLGLGPDVAKALREYPTKGYLLEAVPGDPIIYRFLDISKVDDS